MYAPKWLVLGVNNTCNLHCKMCDVGTKTKTTNFAQNLTGTRPLDMPLDLFQRICEQTAKYYPDTRLGYAFTEPLIYRHFDESLALAKQYNLSTAVTTNGLKLPEKAQVLCDNNVDDVFISLDGTKDIHNDIRGHRFSFQRAIDGMEALFSQKNAPDVSIFCVITEWNIGDLKSFADFFAQFPIKQLGFMHTNFTPQSVADTHNTIWGDRYFATESNMEVLDIKRMNLSHLWQEINTLKKADYADRISFSPDLSTFERLQTFYQQPEQFIGSACSDIFSTMMIKSDGSVIPAHGRCYNVEVGNLNEQNLSEIWNSDAFGLLRSDIQKAGGLLPACSRCCSALS